MRKTLQGLTALAALVLAAGCGNIGGSPEGASSADMKATMDKLPLDDRAKMLIQAPGPMTEDKKGRVKALYEKEGKPIPPDIEKMLSGSGSAH